MAKKKKNILICTDRDGVLIYDRKYYLGKTHDWKKKIKILPSVVEGMKLLHKKIPNAKIFMVTHQPGVAVREFKLLTEERAHKVCEEVLHRFSKKGVPFHGYFMCPFADSSYIHRKDLFKFHKKYVCECTCVKPNIGMILMALRGADFEWKDTDIYMMGDRASDVRMGLKAKGTGILVPFGNEPGQIEKVQKMKEKKRIFIADNFLDAAKYIIKKAKQ